MVEYGHLIRVHLSAYTYIVYVPTHMFMKVSPWPTCPDVKLWKDVANF